MRELPRITKNLLLANIVVFFIDALLQRYGIDLTRLAGLHYVLADQFYIWQPLTYMFMHANFTHLFCNMFAVLMFGPVLEREWGERRFLIYYMVCGIGAAIVQEAVWSLQMLNELQSLPMDYLRVLTNRLCTIGASGAVFGILFAFGWLFPTVPMFILFIPIPIKARTLVILYAAVELFAGLGSMSGLTSDNIAHFAHLGGLLFGWLLLLWWRYKDDNQPTFKIHFPRRDKKDDESRGKDFSNYHYHKNVDK